jgi:hypothetical protein
MAIMPISTSDLYQRYSSTWPFSSLNMIAVRTNHHLNEQYRSTTNNRITSFYINDILGDSIKAHPGLT